MPKQGNYSRYQKDLGGSTDRGNFGGVPGNSFNHKMVGRPLTGRHSGSVAQNTKKYGLFAGHDVGDHFGRSGSPTGGNPMKGK